MSLYPFNTDGTSWQPMDEEERLAVTSMSEDQLQARLDADADPEPIPFSMFPLCTDEGRRGFLEEYIMWGEERLFEGVSHIWNSLNEPRQARCIGIGIAAGTGGSGKWALAKFLRKALRSALDYEAPAPWNESYGSIEDFHVAAMGYFANSRQHYEAAIQTYADILNGEMPAQQPRHAKLLVGPWLPMPSE